VAVIEQLILAFLLVIYATGCAATAVELHTQHEEDLAPSARELMRRWPKVHVLTVTTMIVFWPMVMVWTRVRELWR
jgi:hypothetical protein